MDDILTVKQTAELLGVSRVRVRQMIAKGDLKAERPGNESLLRRADVEEEVERRRALRAADGIRSWKAEKRTKPVIASLHNRDFLDPNAVAFPPNAPTIDDDSWYPVDFVNSAIHLVPYPSYEACLAYGAETKPFLGRVVKARLSAFQRQP